MYTEYSISTSIVSNKVLIWQKEKQKKGKKTFSHGSEFTMKIWMLLTSDIPYLFVRKACRRTYTCANNIHTYIIKFELVCFSKINTQKWTWKIHVVAVCVNIFFFCVRQFGFAISECVGRSNRKQNGTSLFSEKH